MNVSSPLLAVALALALVGCTTTESSTTQRAVATGAGAAAGYGIAKAAAPNNTAAQAGAAAGGALVTGMLLGEDKAARAEGFKDGYEQGQSDAIKRHYWMEQDWNSRQTGKKVYYTMPGPTQDEDGTRLVPHKVTVPVTE